MPGRSLLQIRPGMHAACALFARSERAPRPGEPSVPGRTTAVPAAPLHNKTSGFAHDPLPRIPGGAGGFSYTRGPQGRCSNGAPGAGLPDRDGPEYPIWPCRAKSDTPGRNDLHSHNQAAKVRAEPGLRSTVIESQNSSCRDLFVTCRTSIVCPVLNNCAKGQTHRKVGTQSYRATGSHEPTPAGPPAD